KFTLKSAKYRSTRAQLRQTIGIAHCPVFIVHPFAYPVTVPQLRPAAADSGAGMSTGKSLFNAGM
ncbi:MAG: hypothetical protein ABIT92_00740, partial [Gammaproteobacteria bacterium]